MAFCGKKSFRIFFLVLSFVFLLNTAVLAVDTSEVGTDGVDTTVAASDTPHILFYNMFEVIKSAYGSVTVIQDWVWDIINLLDSWTVKFDNLSLIYSKLDSSYTQLVLHGGNLMTIISSLTTLKNSLTYNENFAAYYLYSINDKLDTLIANQGSSLDISGILTDLSTLISNQSKMLALLGEESTQYFAGYGILGNLETMISNQSSILELLQAEGAFTTDISGILTDLETLISNQSKMLALLGEESTQYFAGYGILGNLETLISNQSDILKLLQVEGAFTTDISSIENALIYDGVTFGDRLHRISTNLLNLVSNAKNYYRDALANQEEISTLLSDEVIVDLATLIENQSLSNNFLSNIESALTHSGGSVAALINTLDSHIDNHVLTLTENQALELAKLTTISKSVDTSNNRLLNMLGALATLVENQELSNNSLFKIESALTHSGGSVAALINTLDSHIDNHVLTLTENQALELAKLTTISESVDTSNNRLLNMLGALATLTENQSTAVTAQQEVNTLLSNIEGALINDNHSVLSLLVLINNNFVGRMKTVFSNQEAVISLLQENGLTVDTSGILAKQQELIDLVEEMNHTTVENIENITIDVSNDAYEIFYISDGNGNEQNLGEFSGDVLSVGGQLLNFFFRVAFDDALDSVDSALDDMTGFYIDDSVVMEGGSSLWD